MKLYVRFQFSSEGASPLDLVKVMTNLGFKPVMGVHDFYYSLGDPEDYKETLKRLHESLRGLGVTYTLTTRKE
jgi:hypothetical protein